MKGKTKEGNPDLSLPMPNGKRDNLVSSSDYPDTTHFYLPLSTHVINPR
jgi:hypothetical protein